MKKSTKIILWTVGAVVSTLIIALIAITSTILSRTPMKSTIPDSPLLKSGGTDPLTLKLLQKIDSTTQVTKVDVQSIDTDMTAVQGLPTFITDSSANVSTLLTDVANVPTFIAGNGALIYDINTNTANVPGFITDVKTNTTAILTSTDGLVNFISAATTNMSQVLTNTDGVNQKLLNNTDYIGWIYTDVTNVPTFISDATANITQLSTDVATVDGVVDTIALDTTGLQTFISDSATSLSNIDGYTSNMPTFISDATANLTNIQDAVTPLTQFIEDVQANTTNLLLATDGLASFISTAGSDIGNIETYVVNVPQFIINTTDNLTLVQQQVTSNYYMLTSLLAQVNLQCENLPDLAYGVEHNLQFSELNDSFTYQANDGYLVKCMKLNVSAPSYFGFHGLTNAQEIYSTVPLNYTASLGMCALGCNNASIINLNVNNQIAAQFCQGGCSSLTTLILKCPSGNCTAASNFGYGLALNNLHVLDLTNFTSIGSSMCAQGGCNNMDLLIIPNVTSIGANMCYVVDGNGKYSCSNLAYVNVGTVEFDNGAKTLTINGVDMTTNFKRVVTANGVLTFNRANTTQMQCTINAGNLSCFG